MSQPPKKALQTDKGKLSRLLRAQEPRQLAFAAELGCQAGPCMRLTFP
jgi:hypothetical protein